MISDAPSAPTEAYVWVWLPGAVTPVVAGRLAAEDGQLHFNYGRSYLDRPEAIPLYEPELPLRPGRLPLPAGLSMPGCLRDAAPDAWGRRVILNRLLGARGADADPVVLDELVYLLESGSDRVGALDFQASATIYRPRLGAGASLEQLLAAADLVQRGQVLPPELDAALLHGSSIGGARPKALIEDEGRKFVAKFSTAGDLYNVVKAEFIAMRLARLCGLDVAPVSLARAAGRDVLLVERFDRARTAAGWTRRPLVSALTLMGLDEMMARYASYAQLAEIIRRRFHDAPATLAELFGRLVFNVLCGNTDDHARNHAAFWDGSMLALTPAYDICPQPRSGNEASQAMMITDGRNLSRVATCLEAAPHFLLSQDRALAVVRDQVACITAHWDGVCAEAALPEIDRRTLWQRQFLNPDALIGLDGA
ncbi:MAG: type II toxin-antitoxin system HipA family toxin [Rhodobacterales bacterium]|nr:type II toxin-antitoxin system HipA family toxin [Rhodobacterales bacterium]